MPSWGHGPPSPSPIACPLSSTPTLSTSSTPAPWWTRVPSAPCGAKAACTRRGSGIRSRAAKSNGGAPTATSWPTAPSGIGKHSPRSPGFWLVLWRARYGARRRGAAGLGFRAPAPHLGEDVEAAPQCGGARVVVRVVDPAAGEGAADPPDRRVSHRGVGCDADSAGGGSGALHPPGVGVAPPIAYCDVQVSVRCGCQRV